MIALYCDRDLTFNSIMKHNAELFHIINDIKLIEIHGVVDRL